MDFVSLLETFGVGRRGFSDSIFAEDKPLTKYGVYDEYDDHFCQITKTLKCHVPSCNFVFESLLDFENHYNTTHRYTCNTCKKNIPSPHLLDLHIQETHDSFFAVMSLRKPSYCCYIEECKEKFTNPEARIDHCVSVHKLPKDFRFDRPQKKSNAMEVVTDNTKTSGNKFQLANNKQKTFQRKGKVNYDTVVQDLKESLPE